MCVDLCNHAACRGFTTLSTTLGRMILSLHDGLLQALASEQHAAAASALLQALQALLRGAPYHRLPQDLLPRTLEVQPGRACCQAVLQGGLQYKQALLSGAPERRLQEEFKPGRLAKRHLAPLQYVMEGCNLQQMWAAGSIGDMLPRAQEVQHVAEHCCGKQVCCMPAGR